jgi:hypothetical protein
MRDALTKLYREMDDDAAPAALQIMVVTGEEMIAYAMTPGDSKIDRRIITNPSALIVAADMTTVDVSVDAGVLDEDA